MHHSSILPPSAESQHHQKTRRWLSQKADPTGSPESGLYEQHNTSVARRYIGDNGSENRDGRMGRSSLKHRLDESSIEITQHFDRIRRDDNTMPSPSASISGNSISTHSSLRPNFPNIGSPRSLSDRKKISVSQASRMLAISLNSSSAYGQHIQNPNQRAIHPVPKSTIPLLNSQLKSQDLTKVRKSSEFGKRMILPDVPEASIMNSKIKKKAKFTPPLISGGYAERFFNLMTYHKSEYTMWANATLRKVRLVGSTKPLAVVEITAISMESNLQWARCRVVLCENEKSPFYVAPDEYESDDIDYQNLSQMLQTEEVAIVRSSLSQDIDLRNFQDDVTMEEDDSIYGLHKDISRMGVLINSKGPILDSMNDLKRQRHRPPHSSDILVLTSQEEAQDSSGIEYLKSSQGSDDEIEEAEFRLGRINNVNRPTVNIQDHSRTVTLPCIGEPPQINDVLSDEEANYNDITHFQKDIKSPETYDSVALPQSPKATEKTPETAIPSESTKSVPGLWILFSNTFNWSRLKVSDRVEIHDPCRKISIPDTRSNDISTSLWIVERYVVVSPDV